MGLGAIAGADRAVRVDRGPRQLKRLREKANSETKGIAGLFGVHLNGGKPKGSANDPIYTRSADKIADVAHKLGGGKLGDIGSGLSSAFKSIGSSLSSVALVYNKAALKYHGTFARLNDVQTAKQKIAA